MDNSEFADCIGKSTLVRVDWKSWDKFPKSEERIWIIIKLEKGYYPVTGTFFKDTLKGKHYKDILMWVRFDVSSIPPIYISSRKDSDFTRLIAWGRPKSVCKLQDKIQLDKNISKLENIETR